MDNTPAEMITAIQAFERDGRVQYAEIPGELSRATPWDETLSPDWDFSKYRYRPCPRVVWVNIYIEEADGAAEGLYAHATEAAALAAVTRDEKYLGTFL